MRELERSRPTTTPPSPNHPHNLATTYTTKHSGIHRTHGYITPTWPSSHNTHTHNYLTWWCHHKPSPVRQFKPHLRYGPLRHRHNTTSTTILKPKPSPLALTRSALSGSKTSGTGWTRIILSPHITFLRAFYLFLVFGFLSVRLCFFFFFFWLCSLGVWFIVSETSLSGWLFCCIPIFCFSILFMFLLSFGRENFVGFTLCGARRRVFHCSYPWIWCLHISDLCVCVCVFNF